MKNLYLIFVILLLGIHINLFAQSDGGVSIGKGNEDADQSAILELVSSNKGLLIPRMTSQERQSISSPALSLLVYDTTENHFYYWSESQWNILSGSSVLSGSSYPVSAGEGDLFFDLDDNTLSVYVEGDWKITGSSRQVLELDETTLRLLEGGESTGNGVDLSVLFQDLSLQGTVLSISKGNSVDLGSLSGSGQSLSLSGAVLSISGGNSVDLSALLSGSGQGDMLQSVYDKDNDQTVDNAGKVNGFTVESSVPTDAVFTDSQTLTVTGNVLSISGGNQVTLPPSQGDTVVGSDDQRLNLSENILSIEGGNSVDLSSFKDNTDNQNASEVSVTPNTTLGLSGTNVQEALEELQGEITTANNGGMTSVVHDASLTGNGVAGNELGIADRGVTISKIAGGTAGQVLTTDGSGNPRWENISSVQDGTGTDAQELSLVGNVLSIDGGNSIDLTSFKDNTDAQTLGNVLEKGNNAGGARIEGVGTPVSSSDAATKSYVDNGLSGVELQTNKNKQDGYVGLGADTKIDQQYLPGITLNSTYTAGNETDQLALTGLQKGDVVIRTDENKTYINTTGNNGDMTDWAELLTSTGGVNSVNGSTGSVLLDLSSVLSQGADASGNRITSLANPTGANDAATKNYVDTRVGTLVDSDNQSISLNGDILSIDGGNSVDLGIFKDDTDAQDLDNVLGKGNSAGGKVISGLGTPSSNSDAATKGYVDSGLNGVEHTSNKNVAGGYVGLESDGKINSNYLPSGIQLGTVYTANNANEQDALSQLQSGDIVVRTDESKTYIYNGSGWVELQTPTGVVLSVNGKTGTVVLSKSDIGLPNVNNTSDADKPVSSATQIALDAKVNSADLSTVATSGRYNDLQDKPVNIDEDKTDDLLKTDLVNNLTDGGTDKALTAEQGKALKISVDANAANIALNATKVALADTAGVLRGEMAAANTIGTSLQNELDATQTGAGLETDGTYSTNTSANYIGSATTLSGADDALDAQLKINADSIAINAADIATNTTAIASNTSNITDNADAIALRATQTALEDTTTSIRSAVDANSANIALNATKVALADTAGVLRGEMAAANTIGTSLQNELDATQTGAGLGSDGTYSANTSANYVSTAGSLAEADNALDTQLKINADAIITNTTNISQNSSDIALKENAANKSTDGTLASESDTKFPTEKAVKTYVDATVAIGAPDATATTKGKIQLAGDLTGIADAPVIANDAVTAAKIGTDVAGNGLVQNATTGALDVDVAELTGDGSITSTDLTVNGGTNAVLNDVTIDINLGAVTDAKVANGISAAKLADGSVSNEELQYLDGVTGDIQTQLDAKVNTSSLAAVATSGSYTDLLDKPTNIDDDKTDDLLKTDLVNDLTTGGTDKALTAEQGKVLKDALDQKAAATNVYTKIEADALLADKVDVETGKGLSANDYTDADKLLVTGAEQTSNKNVANGYAGLDANSKIDVSQLPSITINNVYTVASLSDLLALPNTVQGDVAIVTGNSTNYIRNAGTSGTISDWTELASPNVEVTSVNGKTGNVVIGISDIATLQTILDNKANTADLKAVATSGSFTDLSNVPANIDTDGTNDVLKSDIVNDLISGGTDKVLSAEQGKTLKTSIDTNATAIADNTTDIATNASNIASNTGNIGLKENSANKSVDGTFADNSDVLFPTQKAVKTYVDATVASGAPDATATTKGKIQLAGDLAGTADAPTIANNAVTNSKVASGIDAAKLADGSVSNTEIQYLNGADSNIQTQINTLGTTSTTIQSELDATQTGAGLGTGGNYTANTSTNYIKTATSLKDATEALDTQVKANADAINNGNTTLQDELDATQSGAGLGTNGTYSANGLANYIGSATSLAGADNALDAQLKTNSDAIALRATQAALEDTTTAVRSSIDANSASIALNATKVALADTAGVLRGEIDAANTIGTSLQTELDATQTGAGLGNNGTYTTNTSANYIGSAATLAGADNALDTQVKINADSIAINAAAVASNITAIAANTSDIADNTAAIALRATQAALEDTTIAVRSSIDANSANIALNATKVALADTAGVLRSEINAANTIGTSLQTELDATQTGAGLGAEGTYTANGTANYIGSASSLAGADNALDAQLKINTDSITVNAADIATNTTAIATNASDISDNTAAIALRATQAALEDTTTAVRSSIDANSANIALNATKVALADTAGVLRSEIDAASTIGTSLQTELDATQTGAGLGAEGTYTANGTANYIGSASSLAGADNALDAQLKINADSITVNAADIATNTTAIATNASDISDNTAAIALRATQAALEDTTTAVRSSIDANSANIALNATKVALADTAGVLRGEIADANSDVTALQGELDATQSGAGLETDGTYFVNTSANYISSATTLYGADDALDAQLKINADSIDVNAADIATNTTAIASNTSNITDNADAIALRATQAALNDTAAVLHSGIDANSANIALNATKVALADTAGVLRSEIAAANTIGTSLQTELDATQIGAGLGAEGTYTANGTANYIGSASSLAGADNALDAQVKLNADSIAINAAAIATNTTAIASNTSNISDNADAIALRATQAALTDTATAIRGALVDSVAAVRADAFNVNNLTDTYVPYLNGTGLDDSPMKIASGKVGIATTAAPKEALDVNGNINIAENSSLMIGDSTVLKLGSLITSTAVGVKASTSGNNTTSVGYHAGFNSASSYATLLGAEAGQNGSGSQFTGIGISAGANNNGPNSIAIGPYAGDSLTAASAVVIGYQAGQNNSGEASVTIGREAGQNNTGEASVAIGREAGRGNIGLKQIALGEGAGTDNEGAGQITIGSSSGIRNKGATSITLGSASGIDNTGNNILGIGNIALRGNQGDNVIALGYEAGKNNTLNNQFIVKQSPVNSTPLIQGDFLTGNLNIAGKVTAGANATANMDLVPLAQMNDSLAAIRADGFSVDNLTSAYVPYYDGSGLDDSPVTVSGTNVGIGTTTPVSGLHVKSGTSGYNFGTANRDGIILEDDDPMFFIMGPSGSTGHIFFGDNAYIASGQIEYDHSVDAMTFSTVGNSEKMRITSTGNVGIGTTSPAEKLDVAGNIKASGKVTAGANATANMDLVPFKQMNDSLAAVRADGGSVDNLTSAYMPYYNGTGLDDSPVTITSGKLGLNTVNPITNFHVKFGNSGRTWSVNNNTFLIEEQSYGRMMLAGTDGSVIYFADAESASQAKILYASNDKILTFSNNGSERMRIDSLGNVGIGTTFPAEKLDVAGNIKATGKVTAGANATANMDLVPFKQMNDSLAAVSAATTANLTTRYVPYYDGTGLDDSPVTISGSNVGIGMGATTPSSNLHVKSGRSDYNFGTSNEGVIIEDDVAPQLIISGSTNNVGHIYFGDQANYDSGQLEFDHSVNAMTFSTGGNNERMRINSSGNVGIGTTSPTEKLDVVGDIKASVDMHAGGDLYVEDDITATGKVITGEVATTNMDLVPLAQMNDSLAAVRADAAGFDNLTSAYVPYYDGSILNNSPVAVSGTNVGVGTTTPGSEFHVKSGTSGFNFGTANDGIIIEDSADPQLVISGSGNNTGHIYFGDHLSSSSGQLEFDHSVNAMTFSTAGNNERMRINSTGSVGIGTTSPSEKLDVAGNIKATGKVTAGANASANMDLVPLTQMSDSLAAVRAEAFNVDNLTFRYMPYFNGSDLDDSPIAVGNGSKVGVGLVTPVSTFHIQDGASGANIPSLSGVLIESSNDPRLAFVGGVNNNATITFGDNAEIGAGSINYDHSDNTLSFFTNGYNERMQIDANGNVGIGKGFTIQEGISKSININRASTGIDESNTALSMLNTNSNIYGMVFGKYATTKNSASVRFNYSANGSSSNSLGIGMYGNDDLLTVYANGVTEISSDYGGLVRLGDSDRNGIRMLNPSATYYGMLFGRYAASKNAGSIRFHYSDIPFENYVGIGFFDLDDVMKVQASGDVYIPNGELFQNSDYSDRRLKNSIKTLEPLSAIDSIRFVSFKFNRDSVENRQHYGVIAQEVQKYFPELVTPVKMDGENEYLTMNYVELLLLKVASLEQKLASQEERLRALEAKMNE